MKIWVLFILMISLPLYGADTVSIQNNFIKLIVNNTETDKGLFSIETTSGNPTHSKDDNQPLIFGRPIPWSSYTTISENDQQFILAPKTTRLLKRKSLSVDTLAPDSILVSGNQIETYYSSSSTEIIHRLSFIRNPMTQVEDTALIEYELNNKKTSTQNIGLRIMLDTKLGKNDGAPFRMGTEAITSERAFDESSLYDYWHVFDDLVTPNVIAQGTLKAPLYNLTPPDMLVLANWGVLTQHPWTIPIQEGRSFLRSGETEQDTALAMFWNPEPIPPLSKRVIRTMMGMGGIELKPGELSLGLSAPKQLDSFDNTPHLFMIYIVNTGGFESKNTTLTIDLPTELTSQDALNYSLGDISPGETVQIPLTIYIRKEGAATPIIRLRTGSDTLPSNSFSHSLVLRPRPELKYWKESYSLTEKMMAFALTLENNFQSSLNNIDIELTTSPAISLPAYEDKIKQISALLPNSTHSLRWLIPWNQKSGTLNINLAIKSDRKHHASLSHIIPHKKQKTPMLRSVTSTHEFSTMDTVSIHLETPRQSITPTHTISIKYDNNSLKFSRLSHHPDLRFQSPTLYHPTENTLIISNISVQTLENQPLLKYHFVRLNKKESYVNLSHNQIPIKTIIIKEINE